MKNLILLSLCLLVTTSLSAQDSVHVNLGALDEFLYLENDKLLSPDQYFIEKNLIKGKKFYTKKGTPIPYTHIRFFKQNKIFYAFIHSKYEGNKLASLREYGTISTFLYYRDKQSVPYYSKKNGPLKRLTRENLITDLTFIDNSKYAETNKKVQFHIDRHKKKKRRIRNQLFVGGGIFLAGIIMSATNEENKTAYGVGVGLGLVGTITMGSVVLKYPERQLYKAVEEYNKVY